MNTMSHGHGPPPDELADDDREPSLNDILDAMDLIDGPGVTASDIGIFHGCSDDTARRRLQELFELGKVERQKKGQQTLWWKPERERIREREAVTRYEPVDGSETDAVSLIEASEDDE